MSSCLIISLMLNIILCIDAWWLAKECRKAETKLKEMEQPTILKVRNMTAEEKKNFVNEWKNQTHRGIVLSGIVLSGIVLTDQDVEGAHEIPDEELNEDDENNDPWETKCDIDTGR